MEANLKQDGSESGGGIESESGARIEANLERNGSESGAE